MAPRKRKAAEGKVYPARSSERRAVQESLKLNLNETVKKMNLGVVAAAANGKDNGKMGKGSRGTKTAKPPKEKKSAQTVRKRPNKGLPTRKNEDQDVETGTESPDIIAAPVVRSQDRHQPTRRGRPPLASGESKREKVRKMEIQGKMKSSKKTAEKKPMKKAALKRKNMPKKADLDGPPKLAVENATSRLPELIDEFRIPDNQSQESDDGGLSDLMDETPPDLGEPQNLNNSFLDISREPSPTPPPLNEPLPSTSRGFVQQSSGYSDAYDVRSGDWRNPMSPVPMNPATFSMDDEEDMLVTAVVPKSVSKLEVIRTQPLKLSNLKSWILERMQYTMQDVIYNDRGNHHFKVLMDHSKGQGAPADILTFKVYHLLPSIDMLAPLPEFMETENNYGVKWFYALFAQVILEAPEAEGVPSTSTFQIMHEAVAANAGVDIELLKKCLNEAIRDLEDD